MGEVYRARDSRLDRDVAIKMLPKEIARDPARRRRFVQEAKAVAALSHPNILAIYDFGEDKDMFFAVMELLEGETLAQRLFHGTLQTRKTIELGVQISDGLAAAHSRGIIHRDLKPANIFITSDGRAKILDFGLARQEHRGSSQTQSPTIQTDPGTVMGTVGYMSPEQTRGESVDSRTDIFSLGAILYEMMTGRRAFEGDTPADVTGAILRDEPKPLRDYDASISEGLERVIQHCLEKRPEERFQSAGDLGFALVNAAAPSQSGVAADTRPRTPSRRRFLLPVAILGWLIAAVAFVLPRLQSPTALEPVKLTTLTFSGRDWGPDVSPDGDVITFVSDRDGSRRIWLKQMAGGGEAPITEGPDDFPRFSPDGSQILFVRKEGTVRNLYRTSVVGAQTRKLIDDVLEGDWSPDGSQVVFMRMTPMEAQSAVVVGIADVQTGQERILTQIVNRSCYGIRWSPTGKWITLSAGGLTGNVSESFINIVDATSGEIRRLALTDWLGPHTATQWVSPGKFIVGQSDVFLARVSGSPGQIMEYDVDSGARRPLFWAPVRLPTSGWGFSTLSVRNGSEIVFDDETVHAELHEINLDDAGGTGAEHVLTRGLGRDRQPAFSPDGRLVIFSSNRSGNIDLWLVDRRTGLLDQLTDDPADDWDPAFTPDGQRILWSSNRGGNMEIWMAERDGTRARQVTHNGVNAENPTMTADGQWIVYASSSDEKLGIWKIHPDGSGETRLIAGQLMLPESSPRDGWVLFNSLRNFNSVVRVVAVDSGEPVPFEIALPPTERHRNIVLGRSRWTPDGRGIVYIGQDENGRSGVYVEAFSPDGRSLAESRRAVAGFSPNFATESLAMSPDGKTLVISAVYETRSLKLARPVRLGGEE